MDNRRNWSFVHTDTGSWVWQVAKADGSEETSQDFATLKECTADAMLHGYVAWKSEEERRRDLELGVTKVLFRDANG